RRKLLGVVEVETAESVNTLEAMSQWAAFGGQRVPFHLYVPAVSIDAAKRLCADLQIPVSELWAYHAVGDQMRFTLVQRSSRAAEEKGRAAAGRARTTAARRPAAAGRSRVSRPRRGTLTAPRGKGTKKSGARKNTSRPSRQKRK
ncbi:MAG: hypothetical protein HYY76_15195, partial [Acidobacteria bacterium]|nr:hypothetical protein [Acidobacteriota bacterium]